MGKGFVWVIFLAFFGASAFLLGRWSGQSSSNLLPIIRPAANAPIPTQLKEVRWYVPSMLECRLVVEKRSMMLPERPTAAARELVESRLEDLMGTERLRLESLFLGPDQQWILIVSGASALDRYHASCESGLALYSLVDTLLANFPQGKKVLLIDHDAGDRPLESWGPLDASQPLEFDDWSPRG